MSTLPELSPTQIYPLSDRKSLKVVKYERNSEQRCSRKINQVATCRMVQAKGLLALMLPRVDIVIFLSSTSSPPPWISEVLFPSWNTSHMAKMDAVPPEYHHHRGGPATQSGESPSTSGHKFSSRNKHLSHIRIIRIFPSVLLPEPLRNSSRGTAKEVFVMEGPQQPLCTTQ